MIERALLARVPFGWLTADAVYGNDRRLRVWLEEQDLFHVMAVGVDQHVWLGFRQPRVKAVVEQIPEESWQVLSCGSGAKGERLYEWALVELLSFMLEGRQRWLLVRRKLDEPQELASYVVFGPTETTLEGV